MAIEERPNPRNCGNTNHIQWVRFRPALNSARMVEKTGAWAMTKCSRSTGSAPVISGFLRTRCVCSLRRSFVVAASSIHVGAMIARLLPAAHLVFLDDGVEGTPMRMMGNKHPAHVTLT